MTTPGEEAPVSVGFLDKQFAALSYAADEACRIGCGLRVVHAYTVPPQPPSMLSAAYGIDIDETFRQTGQDVLNLAGDFVGRTHPDLTTQSVLERGAAPQVLIKQAETSRLVVIGPDESRPWYVRLFEGRVARRLANDAWCPTVVVPDSWDAATHLSSRQTVPVPMNWPGRR